MQEAENTKILLVDDDRFILKALTKLISQRLSLEVLTAESLAELKTCLEKEKELALAVCDYHLPDAEKGEAIDFLLSKGVPTIVLTASYDEKLRDTILDKGVVDYLVKGIPNVSEHIIVSIKRALKTFKTKVLVVEDMPVDRRIISDILKKMLFQVLETSTLKEAKEVFKKEPQIKLMILDYYFPEEDALEFLYEIRKTYPKSDLGIIVVSGMVKTKMIPVLLKAGANDFLKKPFSQEEFMVRVYNTLELIELIQELEFLAYHDPLTGLYNRRYFMEEAPKFLSIAKRKNLKLACLMIDIDDFKKINDTYGHEVGDLVLKDLAEKLKNTFKRKEDIVARFGGEEFIVLVVYSEKQALIDFIEYFRKKVASTPLDLKEGDLIKYTVSIGVELEIKDRLKDMLTSADKKLYEAKKRGKNCIVF
ncbi:diguanylate cyclase [Thermodesulfobacterium sp. TA1]|uniref:GGDEF domain-containing response regulator n=1 Tax=Thermodesulfobacterium sp. TA1 TaxID=2234087 RepID=UPI00123224F3|nr:diguanylate cyclase [Thermodesulfobacterium sp. TA1]QER42698.1 diguanylate cyclase [Thermodesulfobacterium sp. TA1]